MGKMVKFGKGIIHFRKKRGHNQSQLARILSLDQPYLSLVENDKKIPSMDYIEKICNGLKVPFIILVWHSTTEEDVKPDKKEAFKILKPSIDNFLNEMFDDNDFKY